ncbi:guanylate kinase [Niveibacterium sp. 24ML]|uniref:guanylate kinase n=1 Tax=Niveibacterium sp. 24ML TaxID=2985512 RepID=UPI0022720572|nr:guanylate kinase [Niveibacterium sp. 24ML]MCX9155384.1 guanylate kinase [Niveibacterium sp. 24ML]
MPGQLYIVSAPSGAGKTTLVRGLLEQDRGIRLSVSHTTRAPRPGEVDGQHYHFTDRAAFEAMRAAGGFLESAEVHGNLYGTSRSWIEQQMNTGMDILLEIDWQGARQVRLAFPQAVGIFVLPPSLAELERRLRGRNSDADEVIARRLEAARGEMEHVDEFHYCIINNDLAEAQADMAAIVRACRARLNVQKARHAEAFAFLRGAD